MRVLHLVKTSSGAIWAWRQMRELVALGVEVHVAIPSGGPMIGAYEAAGIVVHPANLDLPIAEPRLLPETLASLRRLVRYVAPDLIHSHFVGTTLAMRLALGRICSLPRVFQVPGPLHLEHMPFRLLDLLTAGPSDYWIGSCRWTCDRYGIAGVPGNRVFLSYYGTDLNCFEEAPRGELRAELRVPADAKLVGMVAHIYAPKRLLAQRRGLKGHEDLIDALALCRRREYRLHGVVVGGAWHGAVAYEQRVRAFARTRCPDGILFLGNRTDIPRIYADLDVAVHASHSENVGGAVESLLARRPTIATAVGGVPDLVVDGVTGWLVPPRQPARLASAILEVLANPVEAEKRAREGQALARQLFDVKKTAAEVGAIYELVLRDHRRARPVARPRTGFRPDRLRSRASVAVKRAIDVAGASAGLMLSGPLLVLIAAVIRLCMGRPVLFRQRRPGLDGKPFDLLKFRTMSADRDADGALLTDRQRLTVLGRLLRRTSLDELPQLWNVLRGEMSLVGPRPLLAAYLDRYTPEQMRRHEMKPGLTGWAQVNGRNALRWSDKFKLDVWYVDHQSLWLDLKVLAMTVWKTVRREGISQPGHATMEEFKGQTADQHTDAHMSFRIADPHPQAALATPNSEVPSRARVTSCPLNRVEDVSRKWSRLRGAFVRFIYADHNRSWLVRQALARVLAELGPGDRCLNIGAGGTRVHPAAVNVDLAPGPANDCRARAEQLPFRDNTFAVVISQEVLEHVRDPGSAMREMWRVVQKGGAVYAQVPFIIGYHPGPVDLWRFSREGITEIMGRAGLRCERVEVSVGPATGTYRIVVEFIAALCARVLPHSYFLAKAIASLLLYPMKYLDRVLTHGDFVDRIPGGYYAIARKDH